MRKNVLMVMCVLFLSIFLCGSASAAEWNVTPGGSIQEAVNNASANDIINVEDGGSPYTYNENVVVNKTNLTVKSVGQVTVNGSSNPSSPVFTVNNQGSLANIIGFTITGATNSAGITISDSKNVTLTNLTINNTNTGIVIEGTNNNLTIQNTTINNTTQQAILINYWATVTNLTIQNSTISNTGASSIEKNQWSTIYGINIQNTTINNPNGYGILLEEGHQPWGDDHYLTNITINNTSITGATQDGIKITMNMATSQNLTINNSTITGSTYNGINASIRGTTTITNNTLTQNGLTGTDDQYYGLRLTGSDTPKITPTFTNNTITNNKNGLYINNINGLTFPDTHTIENNQGDLYHLISTSNTTINTGTFNTPLYNRIIYATNVENLQISNLNIGQTRASALQIGGNNINITNTTINNNCNTGIIIEGTTNNITINNTTINNTTQQAIYTQGTTTNLTINNTHITNTGNSAIAKYQWSNLYGITINQTTITNPNGYGIQLESGHQPWGDDNFITNITINNTQITNATQDGIIITMPLQGSQNTTINNTTINQSTYNGINASIRGTTTITNNTLTQNGGWGIWIQGYNNPVVVFNSNCVENNGNGLYLQGISGGNFQDNQLVNNTGDDLYATGDTGNTFTRLSMGLAHPTTATFDYINGIITNGVENPPVDPALWYNINKYVDIQGLGTTNVNLTIYYNPAELLVDENSLKMWNYTGGLWNELTSGVNTTGKYVYAEGLTSFSTLAPLGQDVTMPTVSVDLPSGLYKPITVHLTASDLLDPAPEIYYQINSGGWIHQITPIAINFNSDGTYYLEFYAVDASGNQAPLQNRTYTIDGTAPNITVIDPANNAVCVAANKIITVTFNEPIKVGTLNVQLKNSTGTLISTTKTINGNILIITPTSALAEARYLLLIYAGSVTDLAGNPVAAKTSNFISGTTPTITSTNPTNYAVNIAPDKTITITFNKPIKAGNMNIQLKTSTGTTIPINKTINGNTVTITHTNLLSEARYIILIYAGSVTDLIGNPVASSTTSFSVGVSPYVTSTDPANYAVNVARNKVITATFNEPIVGKYLTLVQLKTTTGLLVATTKTVTGNTLTITPTNPLSSNTRYLLMIYTFAVTDLYGNPNTNKAISFTTTNT